MRLENGKMNCAAQFGVYLKLERANLNFVKEIPVNSMPHAHH